VQHLLILGGSRDDRRRAASSRIPETHTVFIVDTATLPFTRPRDVELPPSPRVLLLHDLERAFPNAQAGGVRLVLTQSTYLVQKWIDRLAPGDRIVATADRDALERDAPEALQARGPWRAFETVHVSDSSPFNTKDTRDTKERKHNHSSVSFASSVLDRRVCQLLARAYALGDAGERVRLCREAVTLAPESPVAHVALASACREAQDASAARDALDRAAALAPDWEAVHYESGKLWLAHDDMPRARGGFERAAALMPSFSAAFSNLGATLGELGETALALDAFEQAQAHDPDSYTVLNNVGVVSRELGRLDRSEAALRRVVELAPGFVFGHYNLGHTLFLAGRYADALRAYEEGQRLDLEKNRRQGCRLAIMRLANGDIAGAERDLRRILDAAEAGERDDLLLEAYEIAHALKDLQPGLAADPAYGDFLRRLGSQIVKSE
jgi:tetratricopeptide (TPR) repeat protein